MSKVHKLSLFSIILININIMLGSGIFINTSVLTNLSGSLGALTYILVGIILLPLVLAITKLWEATKGGSTFYHFGLSVSPFFGFLNAWSYFLGKLCSFTLGIHVCVSLLQQIFPTLESYPTLAVDSIVIVLFTIFNLLNVKLGQSIQLSFLGLKLIPIFFVFFTSAFLFSGSSFTPESFLWKNIPVGIPLVLFAFTGFEATCSLSQLLDNPEKNGPKAILISYGIVLLIATLLQFLFYADLGMALGKFTNGYLGAYPALLEKLTMTPSAKSSMLAALYIGIASSSLGSAYGIMYSNCWNLYTLGLNKHTFAPKLITLLNKHNVPYVCVIIEGLIALIYLAITYGQQIPLQQCGALGGIITYSLSMTALAIYYYRKNKSLTLISTLSLISCTVLVGSFIWSVSKSGMSGLLLFFFGLFIFGSYMFYKKHEPNDLRIYEQI